MIATKDFVLHLAEKHGFDPEKEYLGFEKLTLNKRRTPIYESIFNEYLKEVSKVTGYSYKTILSKTRDINIRFVRYMLMYICYKNDKPTWKTLGGLTGGRDHSTAMQAIATTKDLITTKDAIFMPYYNSLEHLLKK